MYYISITAKRILPLLLALLLLNGVKRDFEAFLITLVSLTMIYQYLANRYNDYFTVSSLLAIDINPRFLTGNWNSRNVNDNSVVLDIPITHGHLHGFKDESDKDSEINLSLNEIDLRQIPILKRKAKLVKRGFDIVFSIIALICLIPLFILIVLLIKSTSAGPVFYKPIRAGLKEKEFVMIKFRTMKSNDDEKEGVKSTQIDDPRITKVGKVLRRYSLDELPQFYNVLKGEMSVIGPRPHRLSLHNKMKKLMPGYEIRSSVKPGISGWAQVNGWRGPTKTNKQIFERMAHDVWYLKNWNLSLDFIIVFETLFGKKVKMNAF